MLEALIDFLAMIVLDGIIGLPALPRNSSDWKRRRKQFVISFTILLLIVVTVAVLTILNTYGVI